MGTLRHADTEQRHTLASRNLVGRSRRCALRLDDDAVSGEHATVWWTPEGWFLRDLGSRNGTLRNGERVVPGQTAVLEVGDELLFGRSRHRWRVEDLAPPVAAAVPVDGGDSVLAVDEVLGLPPGEAFQALVSRSLPGGWELHTERGTSAVADGDLVSLPGGAWRLRLPEALSGTVDGSTALRASPDAVALHFRVTRDEEHVELACTLGDRSVDLGSRAHHYLLLTLARARLRDGQDEALPDAAHGWLHTQRLARMLRISDLHVNTHVFRARRQLLAAGVGPGIELVERRPDTMQLRIGVARLTVELI